MAEIKSTLELVMARTKHLTLTEDEKRENAFDEFKKTFNGLFLRFQDGGLNLDHFKKELIGLQQKFGITDTSLVVGEVLRKLGPGLNNRAALTLLAEAFHVPIEGITRVLGDYDSEIQSLAVSREERMKEVFSRDFGISGSALKPNLDKDGEWALERLRIMEKFEGRLARDIASLKASL